MANTCSAKVEVMVRRDGSTVGVDCGGWWAGEKRFCTDCYRAYLERYPQGWTAYPGDTCIHGKYVGGCGIDHICPECEMGYV